MGLLTALGIGATVVGGVMSANSKKKAAGKAADAATHAADANAQVQREQLQAAQAALNPYVQRGNAAGDSINALLGLGGSPQGQQQLPTPQPNALAQFQGYNPDSTAMRFGMPSNGILGNEPAYGGNAGARPFEGQNGAGLQIGGLGATGATLPGGQMPSAGQPGAPAGQTAQQAASNAFDIFRNSTGYQFRLGQGMNAVNSGYAGAGTLQSGAALKAINEYGQNFASNEFGNYMGYLGNQQGVGLSGASAIAGVGQNYANSISNNNNALAGALGNAALVKGNNNPFAAGLGGLGGALSGLGG